MATITTFLLGAAVGGGAKWMYDTWQRDGKRPDLNMRDMREKTAERASNLRQSAATNLRSVREKSAERASMLQQSASTLLKRDGQDHVVDSNDNESHGRFAVVNNVSAKVKSRLNSLRGAKTEEDDGEELAAAGENVEEAADSAKSAAS